MTLDEYIASRCAEYVSALERLATARVNDKVIRDMTALVEHLRSLYQIRRTAFSIQLLERIKRFSEPGSNPVMLEPLDERVNGPSRNFQVGKYYISQHGVFKVTAVKPVLKIEPPLYPKSNTSYFARYMLDEHNRLLDERMRKLDAPNVFSAAFLLPEATAAAEVTDLTVKYHRIIEAKHREFLRDGGMPYLGTQPTTKSFRITHCYSCKTDLNSELYKECRACGWIICSCGACGCGYGLKGFS